jgi:fructose-specific component phosphotransferase system IIB-like protein
MIKRIFYTVLLAAMAYSCSNSGNKVTTAETNGSADPLKVTFESLAQNPDDYVGKTIIVEGKVVHVCTESGKKLFIVGENPDIRLYVAAGEEMSKFPMELLGNDISVEGVITRVGGTSMAMAEGEHSMKQANGENTEMSVDSCETETALAGQSSLANIIMQYHNHTVK